MRTITAAPVVMLVLAYSTTGWAQHAFEKTSRIGSAQNMGGERYVCGVEDSGSVLKCAYQSAPGAAFQFGSYVFPANVTT